MRLIASSVGGTLLVAAVVLGGARPSTASDMALAAVVIVAAGFVAARRRIARGPRSLAAMTLCYLVAHGVFSAVGLGYAWPVVLLVSVGLYGLVARLSMLELVADWFARGRGTRTGWLLVAAVVPTTAVVLIVWYLMVGQAGDAAGGYRDLVAGLSLPTLIALGLGFAVVNAAAEEMVFNGVTQRCLALELPPAAAVVLTAVVFGAVHWYGVPNGWWGVVLATAYGLLLAAVRRVSRGLLLPWVAHVGADITIFTMLAVAWLG